VNPVKRRQRAKGRSEGGSFLAIPHEVMDSPNFRALSGSAIRLLLELGRQYRGYNNGDLCATWKSARGWKSRDTITRALDELQRRGMIEKTRQGGMHRCSLYALTWHSIDECRGKLDVPSTRVASALWRKSGVIENIEVPSTKSVSMKHENRDSPADAASMKTRISCQ
jgi:DNA-binding MarR family transcriptional regulator